MKGAKVADAVIDSNDAKSDGKAPTATLRQLFMLADSEDYALFYAGTIGALVNGTGDPLMMVFFAESLKSLSGHPDDLLKEMTRVAYIMIILGCILLVFATLQYYCYSMLTKRLTHKLRMAWFRAVIRQDIGWFDTNSAGEMPGRISSALIAYETAMGGKFSEGIQFTSTLVTGLFIGFYYNAYVALVIFGCVPFVAGAAILLVTVNNSAVEFRDTSYARANAIAFEVFGSIRTLLSFNGLQSMAKKYFKETEDAERVGIRRSLVVGFANGAMMCSFIVMYAAITVFGTWMLYTQVIKIGCDPSGAADPRNECNYFNLSQEVTGSGILISLLCVAFGGQSMGQIATVIEVVETARKSIKPGVDVLLRTPPIDCNSTEGHKQDSLSGAIELKSVKFRYPARPDHIVCDNYSLKIEPGTTVALVGESGSGKSTIVNLLQRFYDPEEGSVSIDGTDVKEWNLKSLRSHISLVGQEPKLFTGTIEENIRHGCISDDKIYASISREDVVRAAKMANAHDFIMSFPENYNTQVGFGGSQMSGGQKQRIAIARAILKNPSILLLDEATSALDTTSERVVQAALDKLLIEGSSMRTTVVIAHRLQTIRNATKIAVISGGRVAEIGSHEELMAIQDGMYKAMVNSQATTVDALSEGTKQKQDEVHDIKKTIKETSSELFTEGAPSSVKAIDENGDVEMANLSSQDEEGDDQKQKKEEEEEKEYPVEWKRIWEFNKPDFWFLVTGVAGALFAGGIYPVWGIVFARFMTLIFTPVIECSGVITNSTSLLCDAYYKDQAEDMWDEAVNLVYWWIAVLFIMMGGNVLLFYGFGASAERLSRRIRDTMFAQLIRQEPGYFDLPENAVGSVAGRLSNDATLIRSKTGEPLQATFVSLAAVGIGLVISFLYCWPIALMCLVTLPIVGAALTLQMEVMMGGGAQVKGESVESLGVVGEAINAIRTVVSLRLQETLTSLYERHSTQSLSGMDWECIKKGLVMGFSVSINHWNWALLLWWGAYIISKYPNVFSFEDFNIAIFGFFFGLFGLAAAGAGAADAVEAKRAMGTVFGLLDRITKIDPELHTGQIVDSAKGKLSLLDIDFTYPARLDLQVCNAYTLDIPAGKSVGLVGPSGSGKSTAIALLERFYDPDRGVAQLDSVSLPEYNYHWLHTQLGFVGQEPVLYRGTIAENIWMGNQKDYSGNDGVVMDQQRIEQCAKEANAHDFISELPEGYNTDVGTGGERLSGGQKQRVAIARALMGEPKVLLLDEATSALDTESEKIVQSALDKLIQTRNMTSITIAHRLSTVRDLDIIHVVSKGKIIESGTHAELVALGGVYAELARK